jgi:hypothetical protein
LVFAAFVAAVRRAVVVLATRDVVFAALVVALRLAPRACPRAGCFAVDRVALGMACHPSRG